MCGPRLLFFGLFSSGGVQKEGRGGLDPGEYMGGRGSRAWNLKICSRGSYRVGLTKSCTCTVAADSVCVVGSSETSKIISNGEGSGLQRSAYASRSTALCMYV